jgi:succinate-semialdehyde dehydrogenase/glutarate-semialdehyde dehydrogenase
MSTAAARQIAVIDPADGSRIGTVPDGGAAEATAAVAVARAAQAGWTRVAPAERGAALRAAASALRARQDELALLQSRENGRPLGESLGGVQAGIGTLEEYARLGPLHGGRTLAGAWGAADFAVPEPRGVAVALVPWNDPVAIACGPVGACLATGNAVILKPSEKTPLCGLLLGEIMAAHLPDDVLQVVTGGPALGRALVRAPGVDLVLHTGSVPTGREVAAACGERLVKVVLELGGKDPLIVDEGVDPAWAARQAASGAFANAGQVCTSVERIYVHERVAEPFLDALVAEAEVLVAGDPRAPGTTLGPLIDAGQRELVETHVREARAAGAGVLHGARRIDGPGWFYAPTVLADVPDDVRLMREETFGPVAAVRVVGSFDEALAVADAGAYGLAATVLTPSQAHAQRAWRELRVGTVKVNAVWGGAPGGSAEPRGASGLGLGYGPGLLDEVTAMKVVHLEPSPEGP